jgi:capsular polysaccharide transport system permease protein
MAEYSEHGRNSGFARAVTAEVGVRPRAGGTIARFFKSINLWFWTIVGLPTLVAGVYYFGVAADQYQSETRFVVRGASHSASATSTLMSILDAGGIGRAQDDTFSVHDFITSRDAARRLEQNNDLREVFNRDEGDWLARFPGIFFWRNDFEALFDRYLRFVTIEIDSATGVSRLEVKAFRPEDAQIISGALMSYSEALVNELNERARRDTLALARREVDAAQEKIARIQDQLTAYRLKQKMIDPRTTSLGPIEVLSQMNGQLANAKTQLADLLRTAPSSPQVGLAKTRIASLEHLIGEERAKLTGDSNSVVTALTEYERLTMERELAEKSLASAFLSLEAARLQAQRQQLYLEIIAQPNLADYPLYPKRLLAFSMVFVTCFVGYGLAWLLVASVREHAAA